MGIVIGFYTDKKGRKRPITARKGRKAKVRVSVKPKKDRGLYTPAKHKWLADIVSLETPEKARESVRTLLAEFKRSKSRSRKRLIKRATVLAYNRAKVASHNPRLSPKERREFKQIAKIYNFQFPFLGF